MTKAITENESKKIHEAANCIVALIDNPYWENRRKTRIRQLAVDIMRIVNADKSILRPDVVKQNYE